MEIKKCSSKEHLDTNAICYCQKCQLYMCNKCEKMHSSLFPMHQAFDIKDDIKNIFTGICKENNHTNKLEYFCKTHNILCCVQCIASIKDEENGEHKDCSICRIEKIKDEKKNKLKENINCLEELSKKLEESINELKKLFIKINEDKEELKLKIQNIFTKIRNTLNNREDLLLLEVDNKFNEFYGDENIIKEGEKLPNKIKISLEKGKKMEKEWNNNELNSLINDCINIENNIKDINMINENIKKVNKNNKIKMKFSPEENSINKFIENINEFGKLSYNNFKFRKCPNNINETRKYEISGEKENIMTKTGTNGWMGTICENELEKSKEHKWKIKILKTQYKEIMVGVAPIDFDINSSLYDNCGWYFYCYNSCLYSGPPFNYSCKGTNLSKGNDEIIVIMNMEKRTLKFIINNEDKGDSYTNIPIDKPLFPAVILYKINDSVEIIEC